MKLEILERTREEFMKIERQVLDNFSKDKNILGALKNGAFITNLSRQKTGLNNDLVSELKFSSRRLLDQFIYSIENYDFGGDFILCEKKVNGKNKKLKFYELLFDDSSKVLININKSYRLKSNSQSYYVLSDGTILVRFQ